MTTWPNFFIVGVEKAGTTSLYKYLKKIPGVYMSPIKEPWYFAAVTRSGKKNLGKVENKKNYIKLFKDVKNEIAIGEASPVYWRDPKAAKLIHDQIPHAKIIISLRDPVERLLSVYLMVRRTSLGKTSFQKFAEKNIDPNNDVPKPPLYYENVKRILDTFGRNQVKIIIFEEWIKNVKETLEDILSFLGLNYSINEFEIKAHNTSLKGNPRGVVAQYILRSNVARQIAYSLIPTTKINSLKKNILLGKKQDKPTLTNEDKELSINYYQDDVRKLENLLERKFPWPNFQN